MITIITITVVSLGISAYVVMPFLKDFNDDMVYDHDSLKSPVERRLERLNAQRDHLYAELRDIEFDYSLGKITAEDYEDLIYRYKKAAALVIKEIGELQREKSVTTSTDLQNK